MRMHNTDHKDASIIDQINNEMRFIGMYADAASKFSTFSREKGMLRNEFQASPKAGLVGISLKNSKILRTFEIDTLNIGNRS